MAWGGWRCSDASGRNGPLAEPTAAPTDDWIAAATDKVIDVVDKVKVNGTENAVRAARAVVFGLVAAVFAFAALIIMVIISVRLADAYLPIGNGVGDATWAAHLFIGGLIAILGFGLWLSRRVTHFRRLKMAGALDVAIIIAVIVYGFVS